jgi:hypothetical protein
MKTTIWGSDDIITFGTKLSVPFIFPLPFFSAPDRARLSKSAAKALDEAIPIFEHHLAQSRDAPKISDLLNEKKKKEYLANTSSGCYRLHLTTELRRVPGKRYFSPIHEHIDQTKFELLIDWQMSDAAFKAFRAHVSRYPGCDAKNVVLTDEEKKQRGDSSKSKSTVTHVVISAEAVHAFHESREKQVSEEATTCIRFYNERCEKFGTPQGFGHANGFSRLKMTMITLWSAKFPNWRSNEDEKKTGDPECPYTDEELEEQGMGMFFGGGEEYPGGDDHSGGESSGDD